MFLCSVTLADSLRIEKYPTVSIWRLFSLSIVSMLSPFLHKISTCHPPPSCRSRQLECAKRVAAEYGLADCSRVNDCLPLISDRNNLKIA